MQTEATKEYIKARVEWVQALKNKSLIEAELERCRYRFSKARDALKSEEREMLENNVKTLITNV